MNPVLLSSGDLIADRRASYAEMLLEGGEQEAAAELMEQALQLASRWTAGWFRLGEMHEAARRRGAAVAAYRRALELDPGDSLGASLKLALAGELPMPAAPPSAYVETLFDNFAEEFEETLVERLEYRVPELIAGTLVSAHIHRAGQAVDMGCGTGLMGPILRPLADRLVGIDISTAMLRHAEERNVYDALIKGDLTVDPLPKADLVVAADVLMYIGELDHIFGVVAGALSEGGRFVFSVEAADGGDLVLRDSRRFAHGRRYVEAMLEANGLRLLSIERHPIRRDRGVPIEGFIVAAGKQI